MSWRQVSDTIVSKTRGRAFEEERHTNGVVTENVLDPHRLSMPRLQFSPTKCNVAEDTDPLMQVQLADGISIVEYGLYRRDLICTNWLPFQVGRAPVFKSKMP
ncbi:hypothetical protein AG4045_006994 [Apium graveolens]|uniref:Uncharacterized protein n=1 Tax=Apium graveolens TaxID=4045 RepID=A0A6L5B889_APIGR|nr:hypothetical protein AG4045_006994 [Apium graveolens]